MNTPAPAATTVAVVGAGIAGLTTALKLSQRGYEVTLYEATNVLGGNLSASRQPRNESDGTEPRGTPAGYVYHDVYPHMFCDWYKNFWTVFEDDLGLAREDHFEARNDVKALRRGSDKFIELSNPSDLGSALKNLRSGFASWADMLIFSYAMLDLASHDFDPKHLLERNTVDGFLYSQYYTSEGSARLFDLVLREIWSVSGSQTAAAAFQSFVKHSVTFPRHTPFSWLLRGNLYQQLIQPLQEKIQGSGHGTIKCEHTVDWVDLSGDGVTLKVKPQGEGHVEVQADFVVLAIPPKALSDLIFLGPTGSRIVDRLPELAEMRRLRAEALPVVDVYFKRKLKGLPQEHTALEGAPGDLSFLDISQLWKDDPNMADRTAVVLAASDVYAFNSKDEGVISFEMIKAFHSYLPIFSLGSGWGCEESDIDWTRTYYQSNDDRKLFINEVGSMPISPLTSYESLPNVFFAGDYCQNSVAMACIEGATVSGLNAARAVYDKKPLGSPIVVEDLDAHSASAFLLLKLFLGPSAYWARWWDLLIHTGPHFAEGRTEAGIKDIAKMIRLPSAYVGDFVNTAYNFAAAVVSGRGRSRRATRKRL